jgi:hypothetical protein
MLLPVLVLYSRLILADPLDSHTALFGRQEPAAPSVQLQQNDELGGTYQAVVLESGNQNHQKTPKTKVIPPVRRYRICQCWIAGDWIWRMP